MRWRTTAVLAVVLVLLGAFYYVWEIRLGPERDKAAAARGRLFTAEVGAVTEVVLKRGPEVVRLTREGETWRLTEPVKARGSRTVEDVLTTILTAKIDREIEAQPASVADFGLDPPAAEVTLTLKAGPPLGLDIGARSPTGAWVYARERGKPAVFALSEGVRREATRPVADFRDRTVLAFERRAVSGFDLVTPDIRLVVEQTGGQWRVTAPVALPADAETVNDFLDQLQTARVQEFVAESPPARAPFGLARPLRLTIHTGTDQTRADHVLLLGRVDAAKKGVYAMRPGEGSVLLLPEAVWTALPKNVAVVRDKVVLGFESDEVERLAIESPRGAVTVARQDGRWRIVAPQPLDADQVEVGAVLGRLRGLRAQGFLTDDASGIARYLATPEVRATLTLKGAPAPTTLLLAPSREHRGGRPSAYAAVAGRGPVVLVDAGALNEIGRSLTDLRDRRLLPGLEPKEVKRLRLRSADQTVVLERRGDAEWRMVEPTRGAARSGKADDLLYALRALRWREIVAPSGEAAARYGLDAPGLEVSLLRADGTEIATVLVGKREGPRAFVQRGAEPAIYAVDSATLGEPPKLPDDFRE